MSPVDTLEYSLALGAAGVPLAQTKNQAYALKSSLSCLSKTFATKEDLTSFATKDGLARLNHSLTSSMLSLELHVKHDFSQFKTAIFNKINAYANKFEYQLNESDSRLKHKIIQSFTALDKKLIAPDTKLGGEIPAIHANLNMMKWSLGVLIGTTSTTFAKAVLDMLSITL